MAFDLENAHEPFTVGEWTVTPETGRLERHEEIVSLEPKVMALLLLLSDDPGKVFSRSEIEEALWANVVVGEDTVARSISKLRKALGDSVQQPTYIETLPKRGYRLLAPLGAVTDQRLAVRRKLGAGVASAFVVILAISVFLAFDFRTSQSKSHRSDDLIARANDLYMRFTRADNEAAIALYERVLANEKNSAHAQAGLANALVQRVIRWPDAPSAESGGAGTLHEALKQGLNQTQRAQETLERANAIAKRAARTAPQDTDVLKALGLTYAAKGQLDRAQEVYRQAIAMDENAWEAMINLGEIHQINNNHSQALEVFEAAFEAMDRTYPHEPQRIGPWQAALGVLIGKINEEHGSVQEAELWYRRVLNKSPFEPEATIRLAEIMKAAGDHAQADSLCRTLVERVGAYDGCSKLTSY